MSTTKTLVIDDAKSLAYACRKRAVLIIAIGDCGSIESVSYGMNRELCDAAGSMLNSIIDQVESGTVYVPEALKEAPQ